MKKNKGGRPRKYQSVEDMSKLIDEYFAMCDDTGRPYTVTGLCLHLDLTRETLCDYESLPEFAVTIKRAKHKIENYAEERLFDAKNPTGIIFNLKNNWGWKDKHDIEHSGGVQHTQQLDNLSDDQLAQLESILNQNKDA